MKSGPAYLDLDEAARWIAVQLEKEDISVADGLVLRVLNRETAFLLKIGLARAGDENGPQAGHILREACWVLRASPRREIAHETEAEIEERELA